MDKIIKFIDCGIPTFACNFRCKYCYVAQNYLFTQRIPKPKYPASIIGKALSKNRLGGIALFNICANGETLLPEYIVDYTKAILEQGHYVMIVTNGTIRKRFEQFSTFPIEYRKRLFFKLSFHFLELKRKNMIDTFFSNVELIKDMNSSFTIELTPSDELIPFIDEIKEVCLQRVGALPHVTVARDESKSNFPLLTQLSKEDYQRIWGSFNSKLFDFKLKVFGEKRKEYCYAGNWSYTLNLLTGLMKQCYQTNYFGYIFDNIDKPLAKINIGRACKAAHCHNAHAFLCLGSIPEIKTPYYAELRNRKCHDGSEWLQPEMKSFMSTKLFENNIQTKPIFDIIKNYVWGILWYFAWNGRNILKRINPNYKMNEKSYHT